LQGDGAPAREPRRRASRPIKLRERPRQALGARTIAVGERHLGGPQRAANGLRLRGAEEPRLFSAVTVFRGRRRTIVHNDNHARGRQANNIAHELCHALLQHEAAPALSIVGCRDWYRVVEEEASWAGATILIADEAALHIVRTGLSPAEAARPTG
jgi:hypothetical protein